MNFWPWNLFFLFCNVCFSRVLFSNIWNSLLFFICKFISHFICFCNLEETKGDTSDLHVSERRNDWWKLWKNLLIFFRENMKINGFWDWKVQLKSVFPSIASNTKNLVAKNSKRSAWNWIIFLWIVNQKCFFFKQCSHALVQNAYQLIYRFMQNSIIFRSNLILWLGWSSGIQLSSVCWLRIINDKILWNFEYSK